MHIERLEILAAWLEGGAKHETITFDMTTGMEFRKVKDFDPKAVMQCGSSCCIAGAAVQFFNEPEKLVAETIVRYGASTKHSDEVNIMWLDVSDHAREVLELDQDTAERLFVPSEYLRPYNDPAWAARTIRHLIATGEVDWQATKITP